MTAIMPKQYRTRPPGLLVELMPGEYAWLDGTAVVLDKHGGTYLQPVGKTYFDLRQVQADGDPHVVAVLRRESDPDEYLVYLHEPERAMTWYPDANLDTDSMEAVEGFIEGHEQFELLCPRLAKQL